MLKTSITKNIHLRRTPRTRGSTGSPRAAARPELVEGRVLRVLSGGEFPQASFELDQRHIRLYEIALPAVYRGDGRVGRRTQRQLHLHGFEEEDGFAGADIGAWRHEHFDDRRRHWRRQ